MALIKPRTTPLPAALQPAARRASNPATSVTPTRAGGLLAKLKGSSDEQRSADIHEDDAPRKSALWSKAATTSDEVGPYPAASRFGAGQWAALDDGDHFVFELRHAPSDTSFLTRIARGSLKADHDAEDLFDRTIIVIGLTSPPVVPPGYSRIRVHTERYGGDACVLFPKTRRALFEHYGRADQDPIVLRFPTASPARSVKTKAPGL